MACVADFHSRQAALSIQFNPNSPVAIRGIERILYQMAEYALQTFFVPPYRNRFDNIDLDGPPRLVLGRLDAPEQIGQINTADGTSRRRAVAQL